MKKLLLAILPMLAVSYTYAQNYFPATGNVGIGTNSPNAVLQVLGTVSTGGGYYSNIGPPLKNLSYLANSGQMLIGWNRTSGAGETDFISNQGAGGTGGFAFYNYSNSGLETQLMWIQGNGYVGIGTNNPWKQLHVAGAISATTTDFNSSGTGSSIILGQNANVGNTYSFIQASINGSNTPGALSLNPNGGSVGIGTTQPDKALTVNGTIHASEVLVDQTVPHPDYVFDKDYELTTLKDVKSYIDQNHHLPEIPSAAQVTKEGINLGQMNAKLLKKIEELTLYLIEEHSKNKDQQEEINALKLQMKILLIQSDSKK